MSKLEIIALSGVVYKVKSTGPSTEPCGTPYESVTLSEKVSMDGSSIFLLLLLVTQEFEI